MPLKVIKAFFAYFELQCLFCFSAFFGIFGINSLEIRLLAKFLRKMQFWEKFLKIENFFLKNFNKKNLKKVPILAFLK
jgi:hypothetical protein